MRSADWIISETGLQNLMSAGISIGWLKAWLYSAGATVVAVHLLTSKTWQSSTADWQVFFASLDELKKCASRYSHCNHWQHTVLKLDNPLREVHAYDQGHKKILLLPIGDIVYQRQIYLSFLNNGRILAPLYVCANQAMPMMLAAGLSGSLIKPSKNKNKNHYLNAAGLLPEEQLIATLKQHQLSIRTVESCTGGGIAACLCRVPGASAVFDRAWVTYSNAAKQHLGVDKILLDQHGAVSQPVVISMAEAGTTASHICVAVSGVAGPDGGSKDKPVGTVWIAVAMKGMLTQSRCLKLSGARHDIQHGTIIAALCLLIEMVKASQ